MRRRRRAPVCTTMRAAVITGTAAVLCLTGGTAPARAAEFAEIVEFVDANGWRVDLGAMCV
jgi:hypothetical protein